jgi:hypothetical protein
MKTASGICRYAQRNYKQHWACFACRKSFKYAHAEHKSCPQCGRVMIPMGLDFKAPSQQNERQWRKVELLHLSGVHFGSWLVRSRSATNDLARFARDYLAPG